MSDETLLKTLLMPGVFFSIWFCVGIVGIIKELIKGSKILDFGCGRGGFIQLTKEISERSVCLELNEVNRDYLNNIGIQCVSTLSELNEDKFDLITLNHVF